MNAGIHWRGAVAMLAAAFVWSLPGVGTTPAYSAQRDRAAVSKRMAEKRALPAERKAAAKRQREMGLLPGAASGLSATMDPGGIPHYFGPYANWAYSPLPKGPVTGIELASGGRGYSAPVVRISDVYGTGSGADAVATVTDGVITDIILVNGGTDYTAPVVAIEDATGKGATATATIGGIPGSLSGGIRKFVDSLPGLGPDNANNLGQYIPIAVPDRDTYPGSDYYEIELRQYEEKMHSDLPPTRLRGYVQVRNGVDVAPIHYMGPMIIAERDRPVRIKFTNKLPTGGGGDLFIPVDKTVMGAGMFHKMDSAGNMIMGEFTENRSGIHLHGNNTVWISDGTPHQWITPAGESTAYPKGVSVYNVPDMPDPGDGSMTLYYTNQQSARLMFYHDHAYGITRLNVYAGMAAPYVVTDPVEQALVSSGIIPVEQIPLVIQDKTFVDASTIAAQDPTWQWGTTPPVPHTGDLWMPHVYMPNQNPYDISGMNAFGRWHYGPWFWPPTTNITHGPVPNPYYGTAPWEPPMIPGVPNNSMAMEAFMDTPVVNGTAYPYLEVEPKAYRLRILNASDDRFLNLQLYVADDTVVTSDGRTNTEVRMIPASVCVPGLPQGWPTDGREGGVPDPQTRGPEMIQIGNEGGFLPEPVVLPTLPVNWNTDQTNFDFGLVNQGTLILGTAERADVIVDFSQYAGKTLILYNDAPAPFPAIDPRYDYYTGCPDMMDIGGAPSTRPGFGPNTRTIMQIRVATERSGGEPIVPYNVDALVSAWESNAVFRTTQDEVIVPEARYNSAYGANFPEDPYVRIYQNTHTFKTVGGDTVSFPLEPKAIQDEMGEAFDTEYGRMSGFLGLQLPATLGGIQQFVLYPFSSPPVEIIKGTTYGTPLGVAADGTQLWKITHNGVDTHTIHVHMFNAQLVNRVAWDNAIRPPDANELGWKETFRVNPLQDTIVAFRPVLLRNLPFKVPNSVRLIDPTMHEGALLRAAGTMGATDPNGEPVDIYNHFVNFGWEYVYHCHLLAHEEMDMMHGMGVAVAPDAPSNLVANVIGTGNNRRVVLTWADNSLNETDFTIQRATDSAFNSGLTTLATVGQNVTTYTDPIGNTNQIYYYRVFAGNTVGDTWDYNGPNINGGATFPHTTVYSAFSNTAASGQTQQAPAAPSNLRIVSVEATSITISWNDNSANEDGFVVQRARNNAFNQELRTFSVLANVTTFADTGLLRNTRYYYRVRAFNSAGNSAFSNVVNTRTLR